MNDDQRKELLAIGLKQCGPHGWRRIIKHVDAGKAVCLTSEIVNSAGVP